MDIDKVINDRVMLVLRDGRPTGGGCSEHNFYAKVVGRDHIGIWIENPKFEVTRCDTKMAGSFPRPACKGRICGEYLDSVG
jgi:hypothetical protein